MKKHDMTRRDVLTKAVPAAALAGAGFGALAQQPPGQQIAPGQQVPPGRQIAPGQQRPREEPGQVWRNMVPQLYRDGQYQLPQLPYETDALEPHMSAELLEIHHSVHHQNYVNNLNEAVERVNELARNGDYEQVHLDGLTRDITFNGGGHVLHSLFWANMATPVNEENTPTGAIAQAIDARFGSFENFRTYFTRVAVAAKGSAWALLFYEPIADGLGVFQIGDHDLRLVPGTVPILTVDVWEHAYYLQYRNRREEFVNAWWNLVNWPSVNEIYTFFRHQNNQAENMQA